MNDTRSIDEVAQLILSQAKRIERAIAHPLRGSPVTVSHWLVLTHLTRAESATMSQLGTVVQLPAATLTRIVDKLVDFALAYRALDGLDRRRITVRLSDRGAKLVADLQGAVNDAVAAEFNGLESWEVEALRAMLFRSGTESLP